MRKLGTHNAGFSLVLAMLIIVYLSVLAMFILEFMVPYSRSVVGFENSAIAYYQAYSGVEDSIYAKKQENALGNLASEPGSLPTDVVVDASGTEIGGFEYIITASGTTIPKTGIGTSQYNDDFNKISQIQPLQMEIGEGTVLYNNPNPLDIVFKVPDIDGNSGTAEGVSQDGVGGGLLLWQIATNDPAVTITGEKSLLAFSGTTQNTFIQDNHINDSNSESIRYNIFTQQGENLLGNTETVTDFYRDHCLATNKCVLKVSVIAPLRDATFGSDLVYPYLEYKIEASGSLPLRYSRAENNGYSNGYKKTLRYLIPQQTVSTAFDFAVLQ